MTTAPLSILGQRDAGRAILFGSHVLTTKVGPETLYLARCSVYWQATLSAACDDCRCYGCGLLG